MMNSEKDLTGPINVGNPVEFTMLELAKKIIKLTKSKSNLIHLPLPQGDPQQRRPNIELAKEVLRWEPGTQLDEGLIKTIDYFKKMNGVGV
jgi:UDP-glucuronate decarboxylase